MNSIIGSEESESLFLVKFVNFKEFEVRIVYDLFKVIKGI